MAESTTLNEPLTMPMLHGLAALAAEQREIPAMTVYQIDECIAEYESAERWLAAAKDVHARAKDGLVALVQAQGARPAGAEYSKRLLGQRNAATVTIGNTTTVNEQAVNELGEYCATYNLDGVFDKLFSTEVRHKLIEGARTVLAGVKLARRHHERLSSLFGRCFEVKPRSAVLKVELIPAEKPAKKARA